MTKSEIINFFKERVVLNDEQKLYLDIHAKRFETILGLIDKNKRAKVLDIGPSFLSELLYQRFEKNLTLLGFKADDSFGGHLPNSSIFEKVKLIEQDLNFFIADSQNNERYDLIICGEVLEHLYTSPKILFQNFYHLLNKNGVLIIQTPNAVALNKRIAMLFGRNPFEMPRENLENPGHYREYTLHELIDLGEKSKLKIKNTMLDEYFEYPSKKSKLYRKLKKLIPNGLRSGITIVYQRND